MTLESSSASSPHASWLSFPSDAPSSSLEMSMTPRQAWTPQSFEVKGGMQKEDSLIRSARQARAMQKPPAVRRTRLFANDDDRPIESDDELPLPTRSQSSQSGQKKLHKKRRPSAPERSRSFEVMNKVISWQSSMLLADNQDNEMEQGFSRGPLRIDTSVKAVCSSPSGSSDAHTRLAPTARASPIIRSPDSDSDLVYAVAPVTEGTSNDARRSSVDTSDSIASRLAAMDFGSSWENGAASSETSHEAITPASSSSDAHLCSIERVHSRKVSAAMSVEDDHEFLALLQPLYDHQRSPAETRCDFLIREILNTEVSYAGHLSTLLEALKNEERRPRPISEPLPSTPSPIPRQDQISLIRAHLQRLLHLSSLLTRHISESPTPAGVAFAFLALEPDAKDIFTAWSEDLSIILPFFSSPPLSKRARLQKRRHTSDGTIQEEGMTAPLQRRMSFARLASIRKSSSSAEPPARIPSPAPRKALSRADIVVQPLQRVARYSLFLSELQKSVLIDDALLQRALAGARDLAQLCDARVLPSFVQLTTRRP